MADPDYELRTYKPNDQPDVQRLVFNVLREFGLTPDSERTDADLSDIHSSYFETGGTFLVVVEGLRIVGTAGIIGKSDEVCELRKMYLLPEARGQGLGKRLLEQLIMHARQQGFEFMELETAAVLRSAVQMYERYGFKPIDSAELSCRCDQAYVLELESPSSSS